MPFTDLPIDIVVLLFPYLDAKSFLALTSSIPSLIPYCQDPTYWRAQTRALFRIPPQPLLEGDGAHWQRLYKNLKTQTYVYSWGSNSHGHLGHRRPRLPPGRRIARMRGTSGWPQEMANVKNTVGVVADVQCGGWSTVLLNSYGQLWAIGMLNGMLGTGLLPELSLLKFPTAYPATNPQRYEPSTAIQQYSIGRWRALALSDDNRIWEWASLQTPAQFIKFFTLDVPSGKDWSGEGKVKKVVAGWSKSSAYVTSTGIVYWDAVPQDTENPDTDGFIVSHNTVPCTAFRAERPDRVANDSKDVEIGEVTDYVFLENYIVFTTHLQKLFAWPTDETERSYDSPIELTQFYSNTETPDIKSVQGSFLRFGVFTTTGAVLIGNKALLDGAWSEHVNGDSNNHLPDRMRALQNAQVIQLAFGDYHFHALHANGTITSYGTESGACGSLGLGDHNISALRGVHFNRRFSGDGVIHVPDWGDGRRTVWFEEEKQQWLDDTCQKGATNEASPRALRIAEDVESVKLVGEWFERGGRDWAAGPSGIQRDENDDGIEAYYALKITAAGHSSAALMLVDHEKAARVRSKYVTKQPVFSEEDERSKTTDDSKVKPALSPQTLLGSASSSVISLGRWMLGLSVETTQDRQKEAEKQESSDGQDDERAEDLKRQREEAIRYESVYIWEEQPFPRLRYPNGSVLPGEVEISEWKGGEPDFTVPEGRN